MGRTPLVGTPRTVRGADTKGAARSPTVRFGAARMGQPPPPTTSGVVALPPRGPFSTAPPPGGGIWPSSVQRSSGGSPTTRAFLNDPPGEGVQPPALKKGCWLQGCGGSPNTRVYLNQPFSHPPPTRVGMSSLRRPKKLQGGQRLLALPSSPSLAAPFKILSSMEGRQGERGSGG